MLKPGDGKKKNKRPRSTWRSRKLSGRPVVLPDVCFPCMPIFFAKGMRRIGQVLPIVGNSSNRGFRGL